MFNQMNLNKYENIIVKSSCRKIDSSLLAGVARKIRLDYSISPCRSDGVVNLSTGLISPFVFLFSWWVLFSAKKKGIKRLYFLSRDGEIFKKVSDVLNDKWCLGLDLRYLYCSRESLLPPSFTGKNCFDKKWLFSSIYGDLTLQEVCDRVDLCPNELETVLSPLGLDDYISCPEKNLPKGDLLTLKSIIYDEEFCSVVKKNLAEKRQRTLAYLEQEGLCDRAPYALVDSGWSGSSQFAIRKLLGGDEAQKIAGFYVGVTEKSYAHRGDELCGFLFDWRTHAKSDLMSNFLCYEILFSGTHNRVIGYREEFNKIVPVLDRKTVLPQNEIVEIHHSYAVRYANEIVSHFVFTEISCHKLMDLCRKLIVSFISKPSHDVASIYGEFQFGGEISERDRQVFAPYVSARLFLSYVFGKSKIEGLWFQASFVRGRQWLLLFAYNLFLRLNIMDLYRRVFR